MSQNSSSLSSSTTSSWPEDSTPSGGSFGSTPSTTSLTNTYPNLASSDVLLSDKSVEKGFLNKHSSEIKNESLVEVLEYNSYNKDACFYCGRLVSKASQHMILCHETEPEVAQILSLSPLSEQRRDAFRAIQQKGNLRYDRFLKETESGDLVACIYCQCLYARTQLRAHVEQCCVLKKNKEVRRTPDVVNEQAGNIGEYEKDVQLYRQNLCGHLFNFTGNISSRISRKS